MTGLDKKSPSASVQIDSIKVAIPLIGSIDWMGGITYLYYLANALNKLSNDNRPKIYLVFRNRQIKDLYLHKYMFHLFDGIIYVGEEPIDIEVDYYQCRNYDELAQITDVFFPVLTDSLSKRCSISWIPDFQHKYYPALFTETEYQSREKGCKSIADKSKMVVFSSEDAKKDFEMFFPNHQCEKEVLSFYMIPPNEWYIKENEEILKKYNISGDFIICSNQIWKHKNHLVLFEAMMFLKDKGIQIQLILTGAINDYRFPEYFDQLMEFINKHELNEIINVLGFIPREDQVQLLRKSLFVIQPSLFEGWGTVLEDCRALGKTVILSNIPIHHEQRTEYSIFFDKNSAKELTQCIELILENKDDHNSFKREVLARQGAEINAIRYAQNFSRIIERTYKLYQTSRKSC